jgi:predicted PurR-regulated permease PerM
MSSSFLLSILSCALVLILFGALFVLFFYLRAAIHQLTTTAANKEEVTAEIASLREGIQQTRNTLHELQESRAAHLDRASELSAVNVTTQGQVLRLHRRGESIPAISSALRLAVGEVSLIVKVYEMTKAFPMLEKRDMGL